MNTADPLVSELRNLADTDYPLCPEARLLLEMAVDAQEGKSIDLTRLHTATPNGSAPLGPANCSVRPSHCGWWWVRWRVWPEGPQEDWEAVLIFEEEQPKKMYALRAGFEKPVAVLDGRDAQWIALEAPNESSSGAADN